MPHLLHEKSQMKIILTARIVDDIHLSNKTYTPLFFQVGLNNKFYILKSTTKIEIKKFYFDILPYLSSLFLILPYISLQQSNKKSSTHRILLLKILFFLLQAFASAHSTFFQKSIIIMHNKMRFKLI
jgi:hypothetical protein